MGRPSTLSALGDPFLLTGAVLAEAAGVGDCVCLSPEFIFNPDSSPGRQVLFAVPTL